MLDLVIKEAKLEDLDAIRVIYNHGIEDRLATLEMETKDQSYMIDWFSKHQGRYKVLVAETEGMIVGWGSLNLYNNRCVYDGVADLSLYIARDYRGKGVGGRLLSSLEDAAKDNGFHKILLFTFPFNQLGQGLYRNKGYREVGVFKNQGILDGEFVEVMAMEKLL
jgi:L-amino acid N-acyltransferase YncA